MIGHISRCIYDIYNNSGIANGMKNATTKYKELRIELNKLSNNKHKRYYDIYVDIDKILINPEYIGDEVRFREIISKELEKIGIMDELLRIELLKRDDEEMKEVNEKKGKKKIPAVIRRLVWDKYIGEEIGKSVCYSCKKMEISQMNFVCGHVISEYEGGRTTVDNLRPICNTCNLSMGTMNMDKFMLNYFY